MRFVLITLALVFSACAPAPAAPPAAPAQQPAPPPPSAANADARLLQQAPAAGAWTARADEGVFRASFSDRLILVCSAPNGVITLTLAGVPMTVTSLRLISATRTLELAAHGGSIRLEDSAPEHDAFIAALGTPGDRFALDANGTVTVFPWNDAIATTLHACR